MTFSGCKLALFHDETILVYQRDDKPNILYPGFFDLPGGGRENNETPEQTVLRELYEEFGLTLCKKRLLHKQKYAIPDRNAVGYFFVGRLLSEEINLIRFGNEGIGWELMPIEVFTQHPKAIHHLKKLVDNFQQAIKHQPIPKG